MFTRSISQKISFFSAVLFLSTLSTFSQGELQGPSGSIHKPVMSGGNVKRTNEVHLSGFHEPKKQHYKTGSIFVMDKRQYYSLGTISGFPISSAFVVNSSLGHSFSEPLIYKDFVFFTSFIGDGHLFVQTKETGKDVWRYKVEREYVYRPLAYDDKVFFGTSDGAILAADIDTGREVWRYNITKRGEGKFKVRSPLVHDSMLYFSAYEFGSSSGMRPSGVLLALDPSTGEIKWKYEERITFSWPLIYENKIYLGTHEGLRILDLEKGNLLATRKYSNGVFDPTIVNGNIYFFSYRGGLNAVELETGKRVWANRRENSSASEIAVTDEAVYYCFGKNTLNAVDSKSGKLLWSYKTEDYCYTPVVLENVVIVPDAKGNLHTVDKKSGELRWVLNDFEGLISKPAFSGDVMYVIDSSGRLYSFK